MPVLVVPNVFVNGTVIDADPMNENFTAITDVMNNIDFANIGPNGIYASQIKPTNPTQATFGSDQGYFFNPQNANVVPLTIRGATAQVVDLFNIDNATGTKLLAFGNVGGFRLRMDDKVTAFMAMLDEATQNPLTTFDNNGSLFFTPIKSVTSLTITRNATLSANVMEFYDSDGTSLLYKIGHLGGVTIHPVDAGAVQLTLQKSHNQTANIMEVWDDPHTTLLFFIAPDGSLSGGGGQTFTQIQLNGPLAFNNGVAVDGTEIVCLPGSFSVETWAGGYHDIGTGNYLAAKASAASIAIDNNDGPYLTFNHSLTPGAVFTPNHILDTSNGSDGLVIGSLKIPGGKPFFLDGAGLASIVQAAAVNALGIAQGAYYSGTGGQYVATFTEAEHFAVVRSNTQPFQWFYNGTLTVGATFTPTLIASMSPQGALSLNGSVNPGPGPSGTGPGAHLFSGTGVPAAAIGANGDFYFRADGAGATNRIYVRVGGAWSVVA